MKNVKTLLKFQIALILTLTMLPLTQISAKTDSDAAFSSKRAYKTQNLVVRNLSQKLKGDLSENNLSVKLTNLEELKSANNLIEVKGKAFCVFTKDNAELPIIFEAKYNPAKESISDIKYVFVEAADSSFAPSNDEEMLMKTLMKKMSVDYKTEQITIAIDNFETSNAIGGETKYVGTGEVKIGETGWNKVVFDVVMNNEKSPAQINYQIK